MADRLCVVMDASPLITACKFGVKGRLVIDYILDGADVVVAPSVEYEVAELGRKYPDGKVARQRIDGGKMRVERVLQPRWQKHLAGYAMGDGERDSIELAGQLASLSAFIADDYLAFVAAARLGLRVWMLPDLVTNLVEGGVVASGVGKDVLVTIAPRYRAGVIAHSQVRLGKIENAHRRSAC